MHFHFIKNKFIKYSISGISTFLLDLLILWFMSEILDINYLISASVGFIIGITLNYIISRYWAFKETERNLLQGYIYFLAIAGIGLIFVNLLMFLFVDSLNLNTETARIIVAAIVGIWNFTINSLFNFKK